MANLNLETNVINKLRVANGQPRVAGGTRDGAQWYADWLRMLDLEGLTYRAPHTTAANTAITGETSFAATTPTLLLDVPLGVTAIPLRLQMAQSGTVAGGLITCIIEVDIVKRYSSGGTAQTSQPGRTDAPSGASGCTLYSGATATAGFGTRVWADTSFPTVSALGGKSITWDPVGHAEPVLVGPAALLVFTYAGSTGATWLWSMAWAEIPTSSIN